MEKEDGEKFLAREASYRSAAWGFRPWDGQVRNMPQVGRLMGCFGSAFPFNMPRYGTRLRRLNGLEPHPAHPDTCAAPQVR